MFTVLKAPADLSMVVVNSSATNNQEMADNVEQKLKHLMRKAWRERWSDLMWGIYVKEVMPPGTTGDTYNLADCILQQALIGLSPNSLLLSYLQHSLSVQIVSYSSVFNNICVHGNIEKPRCLLELLRLLEQSVKYVSCTGTAEDCADLTASLLSLETWLWSIAASGLKKLYEAPSSDYSVICHYTASLLGMLYEDNVLTSLLYIGRCSTNDQYATVHLQAVVSQTESELKQLASSNGRDSASNNSELIESLQKVLSQYLIFEPRYTRIR